MLTFLLWILIAVTLLCWSIPLLFLPRRLLRKLRVPATEPILFVRLLGAVNLALCLHYILSIARLEHGGAAPDVVIVALLHSGISAAIIWRYALHGHYRRWSRLSQSYIYTSGGILTTLALALLVAGLWYG